MRIGKKWSKAIAFEPRDGIKSCQWRDRFGFTPTYLSEPKDNICFLLSDEYYRMWFAQRIIYERQTYSEIPVETNTQHLKRRTVQRVMKPNKSFTRVMPIITLKRFANPTKKVETRRPKQ